MTMNDNITISKRCNDRTYFHIFDNKSEFDEAFREYIGRDFLNLEKQRRTICVNSARVVKLYLQSL